MVFFMFLFKVIGLVPNSRFKRWLNEKCMLMCMRIGSRAFSALIFFHDEHNKAQNGGINLYCL
jgi:glycerol-3-phosphate O-acyltransferase 3/4